MQPDPQRSLANFRRESRRQILLPFLGGIVIVLGIVVGTLLLPTREHVGAVANCMNIVFLLCPALLCLTPLYFIAMVMGLGMNGVIEGLAEKLQAVEGWFYKQTGRVRAAAERVGKTVVDLRVRLARVEKWLAVFEEWGERNKK